MIIGCCVFDTQQTEDKSRRWRCKGRKQSQKVCVHSGDDYLRFSIRKHCQSIAKHPQSGGIREHAAALNTFFISRDVGFSLVRNAFKVHHFMDAGKGKQRRGRAAIHDHLSRPWRKHPRDARRPHPFGVSRRLYRKRFKGRRKAQGRGVQLFNQFNT